MKRKAFAFLSCALFISAAYVQTMPLAMAYTETGTTLVSEAEKTSGLTAETEKNQYMRGIDALDQFQESGVRDESSGSLSYRDNRIIFSVRLSIDENGEIPVLNEKSEICVKNGLTSPCLLFNSKTERDPFSVESFYEAGVDSGNILETVNRLKENEEVICAEPDYLWNKAADEVPAVVTEEELATLSPFEAVHADTAWRILESEGTVPGKDVIVAVIDTGVDYTHKDIAANRWVNELEIPENGIDDDKNGYIDDVYGYNFVDGNGDPMDDNGHGTHVAGIIGMTAGNGGGVGLAYGSRIMAVKAGQSTGIFSSSDIVKAVRYAVNNGADVINMSFGGTARSVLLEAVLREASTECVLVASAGNSGVPTKDSSISVSEDIYPAGYDFVLGVMSVDDSGKISSFSNWDYYSGANCEYEIAAPGENIYSTLPGNRFGKWSGTSMAAPVVASAAAILRSRLPDKTRYSSRYTAAIHPPMTAMKAVRIWLCVPCWRSGVNGILTAWTGCFGSQV